MTFKVRASPVRFLVVDDYGAHIYMDPESQINLTKEQFYVDKTGKPRLVHPHKYSEKCGDLIHTRMVPFTAPVQVQILP